MQEAYYPMQTDGQQQEQPPPAAPVVGWGVCPHLEWRKGALESTLALYTVRAMSIGPRSRINAYGSKSGLLAPFRNP